MGDLGIGISWRFIWVSYGYYRDIPYITGGFNGDLCNQKQLILLGKLIKLGYFTTDGIYFNSLI
jgi:hypothetical protein